LPERIKRKKVVIRQRSYTWQALLWLCLHALLQNQRRKNRTHPTLSAPTWFFTTSASFRRSAQQLILET